MATGLIESVLAMSIVESVKMEEAVFTTTTPNAFLASTKTVRVFAPSKELDVMVWEKLPLGPVVKKSDA